LRQDESAFGRDLCHPACMADIMSREQRSRLMSRIRGKDTKPERIVRSMLHRAGFRFTVNGPLNRTLPGKPDIVLPKYKTVVFVHGCFWHRHQGCRKSKAPSSNKVFWKNKLSGNAARDRLSQKILAKLGWRVIVIWECELDKNKTTFKKATILRGLIKTIEKSKSPQKCNI